MSAEYKTARGLSTDDLDQLDRAHKALITFETHIVAKLRERGEPVPGHSVDVVLNAIAYLISEPVLEQAEGGAE